MDIFSGWGILFLVYAVLEAAWLTTMRGFYSRIFDQVSTDGRLSIKSYPAVALSYGALLSGAFSFVRSAQTGVTFGAVVYGVYNCTNKATLAGYPWRMVIADTAWGSAVFALLGYLRSYLLLRRS